MQRISHKMSLRTTLSLILFILGMAVVLYSCYPGYAITAADTDIIATYYDKDANFATKLTYSIPDKILRLTNSIVDADSGIKKRLLLSVTKRVTCSPLMPV